MGTAGRLLISAAVAGLLYAALTFAVNRMHSEAGEEGVTVSVADLPPAVRSKIDEESRGGSIQKVEQASSGGKTIYEADILIDGEKKAVTVSDQGEVIRRAKMDDDDD